MPTAGEIFGEKDETLFTSLDLERAFNRVPIKVIKWSMRTLDVDEWLIRAVVTMYRNSNSFIRVNNAVVEKFDVKIGAHRGSI